LSLSGIPRRALKARIACALKARIACALKARAEGSQR
jgi:hypothetical protein